MAKQIIVEKIWKTFLKNFYSSLIIFTFLLVFFYFHYIHPIHNNFGKYISLQEVEGLVVKGAELPVGNKEVGEEELWDCVQGQEAGTSTLQGYQAQHCLQH